MRKSLKFSDSIKQIALAEQDEQVEDDTLCFVTGWGRTLTSDSREKLRGAFVPLINQEKCIKNYINFIYTVTDQMICAGFEKGQIDSCSGDSGGPLTAADKLIGVISWGYNCALPGYPGVYARVSAVREWIDAILTTQDEE